MPDHDPLLDPAQDPPRRRASGVWYAKHVDAWSARADAARAALAAQTVRAERVEAERDALRGAVEVVRAWSELEIRSKSATDWKKGMRAAAIEVLDRMNAALAAARIEAGLATSRERPGA